MIKLDENTEIPKIIKKPLAVLIKFKSMADIFMGAQAVYFDGHGNLCSYNHQGQKEQLAPSYFSDLGQLKRFENGASFPRFVIEAEYSDIFQPNMALRCIASGKYSLETCIEIAKEATLVP